MATTTRTGSQADLALVALVICVLAVLFIPVPPQLLDFLILTNFSFALLLLLLTFYMRRPVEFSTFPSLLLIATLFRLSLNVAATRLILSHADAGAVIGAIGSYAVGGNYVIGLIVFLILVVVQYVVVTSGAQRVSEVAARFALDSMPGQQMSIDADLNMGLIDQDEAKSRRRGLEKETTFYGAMDGASKFVKGDAIAGILILLINIIGGLVIGMTQNGMRFGDALHTYALLTIGDGVVTQLPALVISVGTGIIVTRSSSDRELSLEVVEQLTSFPKTLLIVGVVLAAALVLPGIPALPLLTLILGLAAVTWLVLRAKRRAAAAESDVGDATEAAEQASDDPYAALALEAVEVHVGSAAGQLFKSDQTSVVEKIAAFRRQYALDFGMVLPRVKFRDAPRMDARHYEIHLYGVPMARGELHADRILAIHASGDLKAVPGIATREPTYGLPALWIADAHRELARQARYTLIDPQTVFFTHLSETLRQQSAMLLTRSEMDKLLEGARSRNARLVDDLIPTVLSVADVQKVLQNLLREKVSIRNLDAVLEALADTGRATKDAAMLTEAVRLRLGPAICHGLLGDASALQVVTLDPVLEQNLFKGVRQLESSTSLLLEPSLVEQLLSKLAAQAERMMKDNLIPVLLCAPELRRHVRSLSERVIPQMRILAMTEVPRSVNLKSYSTVALN